MATKQRKYVRDHSDFATPCGSSTPAMSASAKSLSTEAVQYTKATSCPQILTSLSSLTY